MKKTFKVEVDCANCAAKMEAAIKKLEGVVDANINFMGQKLTLEADDAKFDDIVNQAEKAMQKVDSDACLYH